MKRIALLAAIGTLLAADAVLLLGVSAARRGEPDAVLHLTESELFLPHRSEENSALLLHLQWSRPTEFGPAKLAELGFDANTRKPAAKPVFAVLELAPEAAMGQSRLRAIDAGTDPARLRAQYPDRGRYAIARGIMRGIQRRSWTGWLSVMPQQIYVPPRYMPVFRGLTPTGREPHGRQRYEVSLCFGARGELWICGAK